MQVNSLLTEKNKKTKKIQLQECFYTILWHLMNHETHMKGSIKFAAPQVKLIIYE